MLPMRDDVALLHLRADARSWANIRGCRNSACAALAPGPRTSSELPLRPKAQVLRAMTPSKVAFTGRAERALEVDALVLAAVFEQRGDLLPLVERAVDELQLELAAVGCVEVRGTSRCRRGSGRPRTVLASLPLVKRTAWTRGSSVVARLVDHAERVAFDRSAGTCTHQTSERLTTWVSGAPTVLPTASTIADLERRRGCGSWKALRLSGSTGGGRGRRRGHGAGRGSRAPGASVAAGGQPGPTALPAAGRLRRWRRWRRCWGAGLPPEEAAGHWRRRAQR